MLLRSIFFFRTSLFQLLNKPWSQVSFSTASAIPLLVDFSSSAAMAISYTVGSPQSKTALFNWIFFRLESSGPSSYRQSNRFDSFCALSRGGWCAGVLLYRSRNRLAALCFSRFLREQRLDEPSSQQVGGYGISRKPIKQRSWSCTQPRAAKAAAGAAVVGSMGSIPRAAAVV